ncbi:MAG: phage holin family protein [Prevotella sp.]|nr:phage holin family protein [Prevotella sp.]MBQ6209392.1 phage holin family protein [Prevotella sp.]
MFSNDRNIETIGQLAEVLKHYVGLQKEYVKLDVIEKVVRLITVLTLSLIFAFLVMLMLIYLSFAAAYALTPHVGAVAAFSLIAGFYLFILVLFFIFRKRWIEKPLVRFLASLLMDS